MHQQSPANGSATLVWQNPSNDASHVFKLLRQHLLSPETVRFRAAVAYVSWGGLSLISEALEAFLEQGKLLETIYGIENGVTTPDALLYSVYLQRRFANYKIAKSYRWNYVDSEFHAKYFEFDYPRATGPVQEIIGVADDKPIQTACGGVVAEAPSGTIKALAWAGDRPVATWTGTSLSPSFLRSSKSSGWFSSITSARTMLEAGPHLY